MENGGKWRKMIENDRKAMTCEPFEAHFQAAPVSPRPSAGSATLAGPAAPCDQAPHDVPTARPNGQCETPRRVVGLEIKLE